MVTVVVMRMVRELNRLYGKPISADRAYAVVIGLVGGVMPTGLARLATSTIAPFVPGYNLVGLAVSSVTASTYTRSVGRILIDHLEGVVASQRDRSMLRAIRRWGSILRARFMREQPRRDQQLRS